MAARSARSASFVVRSPARYLVSVLQLDGPEPCRRGSSAPRLQGLHRLVLGRTRRPLYRLAHPAAVSASAITSSAKPAAGHWRTSRSARSKTGPRDVRRGTQPPRRRRCRRSGMRGSRFSTAQSAAASTAPSSIGQIASMSLRARAPRLRLADGGNHERGHEQGGGGQRHPRPKTSERPALSAGLRQAREAHDEHQHERGGGGGRQLRRHARGAVAEQVLERELGERASGQRQSGEAEAEQRRDDQRRAFGRGRRARRRRPRSGTRRPSPARGSPRRTRPPSPRPGSALASAMPKAAAITPIWLTLE